MIIRDATVADVHRCNEVWLSTQTDVPPVPVPDQPLTLHELRTGRLVVAEHEGTIIGFGGTLTRSDVLYIADLFVEPEHQSKGAGRALVGALCDGHRGPLFTFASADPRAQRLYEQAGMTAVEPYHYLEAAANLLIPWSTDVELVAAEREQIVSVDAAITGRDRIADIDYAIANQAVWYLAVQHGRPVGAAAVAPTWWSPWHPRGARVGPVMAQAADDLIPIVSAAVSAALPVANGVEVVSMYVPAGVAVLPQLLHAGFEIVDSDLLMASDPSLLDPRRYLPTVDTP